LGSLLIAAGGNPVKSSCINCLLVHRNMPTSFWFLV